MPRTNDVITEVLGLLEPMVAPDGGALRIAEFSDADASLVVDYLRGSGACESCVVDGDSLKVFIEEGLAVRGVQFGEVTVRELDRHAS